jgi:hypothetical protein
MRDDISTVNPFFCEGLWVTNWALYYKYARLQGDRFYSICDEYHQKKEQLAKSGTDELEISHELDSIRDKAFQEYVSLIVFACMAFEGFLNYYGVKKLGESFYKKNIERLGITEKLSAILAICRGILIESTSDFLQNARGLFDKRNSLVHPKAKEITSDNIHEYLSTAPVKKEAADLLNCIDLLLKGLTEFDPEIEKEVKPM